MTKRKTKPLTWIRRVSQLIFLMIFLWLFIQTDYHGADEIPYAVNVVFRIDPLIGAAAILASRTLIALVLPGLLLLLSALIFGRWFCGWVCPLGTLLDLVHPVTQGKKTQPGNPRRKIRFALLVIILVTAFFSLPLVGIFDPFAILTRGLAVSVYPAFDSAIASFFSFTYQHGSDTLNTLTEPVYDALKATILPFRRSFFQWTLVSALILVAVFFLEKWERRGFCRNICPLGALYGLTARIGFFRGYGGNSSCGSCSICSNICRMAAIDQERNISMTDCNLCMDCVEACPRSIISFRWTGRSTAVQPAQSGISRRTFIGATLTGIVLPAVVRIRADTRSDLQLIRPPGAREEEEFLNRCVRCGECMKVCIGNALHPVMLEAGIGGMFSPVLLPRVGYCEYNCTLCGQVCPTGAIRRLLPDDKRGWVIGTAEFDKNRCLPYRGVNCMVCEEHCPVPGKAIRFREVETGISRAIVKEPYVDADKCIGCGICEHKCPLPGPAAIHVTVIGETRNPLNADPASLVSDYPST